MEDGAVYTGSLGGLVQVLLYLLSILSSHWSINLTILASDWSLILSSDWSLILSSDWSDVGCLHPGEQVEHSGAGGGHPAHSGRGRGLHWHRGGHSQVIQASHWSDLCIQASHWSIFDA